MDSRSVLEQGIVLERQHAPPEWIDSRINVMTEDSHITSANGLVRLRARKCYIVWMDQIEITTINRSVLRSDELNSLNPDPTAKQGNASTSQASGTATNNVAHSSDDNGSKSILNGIEIKETDIREYLDWIRHAGHVLSNNPQKHPNRSFTPLHPQPSTSRIPQEYKQSTSRTR
ncbi:hypothetical protein O3M35_010784 [Rhynocoris fuscipes]|uniref:Uncharacterized protein n=1 Tax=Rhynocoris fuscipes TaxID=488301 RepID=A0AAW1D3Z9_9HEMI